MKTITTQPITLQQNRNDKAASSTKANSKEQLVAVLCLLFFPFMYLIGSLITNLI